MYEVGRITYDELKVVIKKLKRHKTPGPDEVPIEVFKEMSRRQLTKVLEILNEWWEEEDMPEEALLA